jgi:hypothetical protein
VASASHDNLRPRKCQNDWCEDWSAPQDDVGPDIIKVRAENKNLGLTPIVRDTGNACLTKVRSVLPGTGMGHTVYESSGFHVAP